MAVQSSPKRLLWWSTVAGVVSAGVFLAVAELVALVVARESSPILAVGSFVIDIVPRPLKEFAITTFGENDKPALLVGLAVAVVVAAAVSGLLQYLRPPLGVIALGAAGALSLTAIVTRAGASPFAFLPPVVGTIAGAVLLILLIRRLRAWRDDAGASSRGDAGSATVATVGAVATVATVATSAIAATSDRPRPSVDRRGFFRLAGIAGASALVVGIGARVVNATTSSIAAVRRALTLPAPTSTVVVPDGAELDIPGISPLFTPNRESSGNIYLKVMSE